MLDILCTHSGGAVSQEDCIRCSHETACFPTKLIETIFQDMAKEREGIHVTDLTGCLKKAFFRKTTPAPLESLPDRMTRILGTLIHDALSDNPLPVRLANDEVEIVGTTDGGNGRLIEIKTTRWIVPSKLPYGNHVEQAKSYMAMRKRMGIPAHEAVLYYIDMSGPYKCPVCKQVYTSCKCGKDHAGKAHGGVIPISLTFSDEELEAHAEKMLDKAARLQRAVESLDATGLEAGERWECNYCEYHGVCDGRN